MKVENNEILSDENQPKGNKVADCEYGFSTDVAY